MVSLGPIVLIQVLLPAVFALIPLVIVFRISQPGGKKKDMNMKNYLLAAIITVLILMSLRFVAAFIFFFVSVVIGSFLGYRWRNMTIVERNLFMVITAMWLLIPGVGIVFS